MNLNRYGERLNTSQSARQLGSFSQNSRSESDIKNFCLKFARNLGYEVISTSSNRKSKNTRSTPDAFIAHQSRPYHWIAIEFKREKKFKISEGQQKLIDKNLTFLVTSPERFIQILNHNFKSQEK